MYTYRMRFRRMRARAGDILVVPDLMRAVRAMRVVFNGVLALVEFLPVLMSSARHCVGVLGHCGGVERGCVMVLGTAGHRCVVCDIDALGVWMWGAGR